MVFDVRSPNPNMCRLAGARERKVAEYNRAPMSKEFVGKLGHDAVSAGPGLRGEEPADGRFGCLTAPGRRACQPAGSF
jgi:hypothetical protein